ncbi:MAG: hypothetical protein EAZ80_01580 [Runella slithyformis]|nr:MAG: hypothetical protein EAZ80_01580 [Runella slithyformis]TAF48679.1 MAG: hypothetical protein EAZ63_03775 [Runella slithyformis]
MKKILWVLLLSASCSNPPPEATDPVEPVFIKEKVVVREPANCVAIEAYWQSRYDSLRRAFARYVVKNPPKLKLDSLK